MDQNLGRNTLLRQRKLILKFADKTGSELVRKRHGKLHSGVLLYCMTTPLRSNCPRALQAIHTTERCGFEVLAI
ncbi:hypothetical protein PoB_006686900 [Plakobranchus ocellatus]|uniref:Uncharacterized protein n=1 Tax=Plakobranchus ocellatus TaxID=259542 RepID=A0AAV4D885_9GAST|nr:hypothetical protein PoB_006686900 [Plakobranchus ocellatus]